jgi:hypothetical protein
LTDGSRKGLVQTFRDTQVLRKPERLYERALGGRLDLGTFRTSWLKKNGVGVMPLWPYSMPAGKFSRLPSVAQAWHSVLRPPGTCLWVFTTTGTQGLASWHAEFMGDIARVARAVSLDTPRSAEAESYELYLAPRQDVISAFVSQAFSTGDTDRGSLVRAWFPFAYPTSGRPAMYPEGQQPAVRLAFEVPAGLHAVLNDQTLSNVSIAELHTTPTVDDVISFLDAFVTSQP